MTSTVALSTEPISPVDPEAPFSSPTATVPVTPVLSTAAGWSIVSTSVPGSILVAHTSAVKKFSPGTITEGMLPSAVNSITSPTLAVYGTNTCVPAASSKIAVFGIGEIVTGAEINDASSASVVLAGTIKD